METKTQLDDLAPTNDQGGGAKTTASGSPKTDAARRRYLDWKCGAISANPEQPDGWELAGIFEQQVQKWTDNAAEYAERAYKAERALRELVALKDLKDKLETYPHPADITPLSSADYRARKPLAWEAARVALGRTPDLAKKEST